MLQDIQSIWAGFPDAAIAVSALLLAAPDIDGLWAASTDYRAKYNAKAWDEAAADIGRAEAILATLGPEAEQLRREIQRDLAEIMQDEFAGEEDDIDMEDIDPDAPFAFGMSLIRTHPTYQLNFDYPEIFGETRRLRDEIGALITASRGTPPLRVILPGTARDAADDQDWDEDDALMLVAETITAYWPPVDGKPALILSEVQEDGGLPIEIMISAHSSRGHDAFLRLIQDAGGYLE